MSVRRTSVISAGESPRRRNDASSQVLATKRRSELLGEDSIGSRGGTPWRGWREAANYGSMFVRYALRTTDLKAARSFYADALGLDLPEGASPNSALEAWPLHERARALGAPAHWLGQVAVDDVESAVDRFVARGSQALGPIVRAGDGTPFAALRDPFGAVVGVRAGSSSVTAPVVWHQLHTSDMVGSWVLYQELFGWKHRQMFGSSEAEGGYRLFAWNEAGTVTGGMGNTARLPGVHPHWLYYFQVDALSAALGRVRALGGTTTEPVSLPSGMQLAACEDPQGAAFGLASAV